MPSKADVFSCVYLPSVSPPQRYVYHVVAPSCLTVCDPMDCTTPGFLFLHHLLELAQTHVPWVSDVIQPSHPLSSPSPPAFSLSQHQGLFQELALRIRWSKYWSFSFSISPPMNIQGWFPLELTGLISLLSRWLSRVLFSSITVWKHQFFSAQPSLRSNSHIFLYMTPGKISIHDFHLFFKIWMLFFTIEFWGFYIF